MPRAARIIIPGIPHHVVQRGNRQQAIFFDDDDRRAYVSMLSNALRKSGTNCLGWCLMDNHIHLILVPDTLDGLRAPLASTHTNFAQWINRKMDVSGHLFQGRFASYPMDDAHLFAAMRYVDNNPVKAGLVKKGEDWPWSSARAHASGCVDSLTNHQALAERGFAFSNWGNILKSGFEAGVEIEQSLKTGRPLAQTAWIAEAAAQHGLNLAKPTMGRPRFPKRASVASDK